MQKQLRNMLAEFEWW